MVTLIIISLFCLILGFLSQNGALFTIGLAVACFLLGPPLLGFS